MTKPLISTALRSVRSAQGLSTRELARRAEISHTRISRIESGDAKSLSRDVVVRIAEALDRNPAPLLILTGHLRDDRARLVLRPMFRAGAELPEAWPDDASVSLDRATEIVDDPRSTHEDLMAAAAAALEAGETDETLWDRSHARYLAVNDASDGLDDEIELMGIWRYVRGARRTEFLRYGRALRELEDLEYIAWRDAMALETVREASSVAPEPPLTFDRAGLETAGFTGFAGVESLRDGCLDVPTDPGVYVVLRVSAEPVSFSVESAGGHFKRKDPALDLARLEREWVEDAIVVYIGSAGNLRRRVDELTRFGRGEPIGHWGGRALWQLSDHAELVVAWQPADDPVGREADLLELFRQRFGRLPFANLRSVKR